MILEHRLIVMKKKTEQGIQSGFVGLGTFILSSRRPHTRSPQANLDVSATTVNLILSKKLLMFTSYLGVGYNSTKTTFNVDGDYTIGGFDATQLAKIDFESKNAFRANIGFRFNMAVIALQANYTFAEYPTATVGIGISVR